MLHEKKKDLWSVHVSLPVSTLKKVSHLHSPIYHLLRLLNKIDIKSMCYLSDIRSFTYTIFNITQTFIRWVVTCRSSLSALVNVYFPDTPFLQSTWFVCHTLLELDKKNFAPILNFSFRGWEGGWLSGIIFKESRSWLWNSVLQHFINPLKIKEETTKKLTFKSDADKAEI